MSAIHKFFERKRLGMIPSPQATATATLTESPSTKEISSAQTSSPQTSIENVFSAETKVFSLL